jgi:hypothetical protein
MKTLLAQSRFIIIAAALYQLTGCAPVAPNLDNNFGNSLNALKAYQTINPEASANTANPDMDGRAAKEAIDRYYKSFSAPAPHQNVFTIGVGRGAQ